MKKYPFIMQLSEDDCGAACVAMMIKKMCNVELSIGKVKYIIKNTENGSTYLGIKKGLEKLGIFGEVAKLQKNASYLNEMRNHILLTQISKDGCIHYVLIYDISKEYLILADPADTKIRKIKMQDFIPIWLPYVYYVNNIKNTSLLNEYRNSNEKSVEIPKVFWQNKGKIVASWIVSFLITVLAILSTFSFTFFFDAVIPQRLIEFVPYIAFIFMIVLFLQIILNFLATKISLRLNNQIDLNLTSKILENVFSKEFEIIESYKNGEIITRLQNVSQIREKYLYWVIRFPVDVLMILMTLYLLLEQNTIMTFLLLFPISFSIAIVCITHTTLRDKSLSLYNKGEKFSTLLIHIIGGLETIKALEVVKYYKKILLEKLEELKRENENFLIYSTVLSSMKSSLLSVFSLMVLALGSYYVISGKLGSGTLLMFNSLSMQILNPFMSMTNLQTTYEQGKIAELKCKDLMQTKTYQKFGIKKIKRIEKVSIEKLSFEYQIGIPIIKESDIDFQANMSYAILGESGAGKTTFAKILSTYYSPTSGLIKINNVAIELYDIKQLHENILYVPQNAEIFPTSILDNILMGREISREIVEEKAKALGLHNIIKEFPQGYGTIVGENGVKLSMGQRQLLNIVRSTLENYQIIIFDEITNGLDYNYREKVKKYLINYGNIKIYITHDRDFADFCDRKYEITDGIFKKV